MTPRAMCSPRPTRGASQVSRVSFSSDASGNRIASSDQAGNSVSYGYDQAGNLTSYSGTTYAYNGDHLRTVKNGYESFTYDLAEGLPAIIQDGSTNYVSGLGGLPLEQVNADGSVLYYHQDHLGSTRALTDSTGAVAAIYDYDPYGLLTGSTGSLANPNPFLYAGQYQDSESGLYYLRARYYDPQTAQFISRDPATQMTRAMPRAVPSTVSTRAGWTTSSGRASWRRNRDRSGPAGVRPGGVPGRVGLRGRVGGDDQRGVEQ